MPEVLKTNEAAKLLRVTPNTLKTLASKGKVPACKIGNHWRFQRDSLLAFVAGRPAAGKVA